MRARDVSAPGNAQAGGMITSVAPRVLPIRKVVGWAAVLGTVPYLALKFAWLSGSTVGVVDDNVFGDTSITVLNWVTAAMDALVIVVAMAFTYNWGQRVPAFLVLVPIWVATGFLTPIAMMLPFSGFLVGDGPANPVLESWVQPMVYAGFGWQGVTLAIAFVFYARVRWAWVFHVERVRSRAVSVVLGDLGAALAAVAGVWWLVDGTVVDRQLGALALLASGGALVLVHGVRTRFWVPVALTWVGAGAIFAWGSWAVLNSVTQTALSSGALSVVHLAAMLGGGLIGVASLVLLSGYARATGGRTARP